MQKPYLEKRKKGIVKTGHLYYHFTPGSVLGLAVCQHLFFILLLFHFRYILAIMKVGAVPTEDAFP